MRLKPKSRQLMDMKANGLYLVAAKIFGNGGRCVQGRPAGWSHTQASMSCTKGAILICRGDISTADAAAQGSGSRNASPSHAHKHEQPRGTASLTEQLHSGRGNASAEIACYIRAYWLKRVILVEE
jgi:hypothetical protein